MGKFFLMYLLFSILSNPITAFIIIVILFILFDRRYMRWFPRLVRHIKNWQRLSHLLKEIEANPHNVTDQLEVGRLYADRKQFAKAIPYLERALKRMEDHADGLFYLGLCYLHTGDVTAGIEKIETALAMNPRLQYGRPYLQLARYYEEQANDKEALHSLQRGDEAGISTAEMEYYRGKILQKLGHTAEAEAAFNSAIQYFRTAPKYLKKDSRRWAILARLAKLKGMR